MSMKSLFLALADVFDGPRDIEKHARAGLLAAARTVAAPGQGTPLPQPFLDIIAAPDAHPLCRHFTQLPLPWAPPRTSSDPLYRAHSAPKVHVELLGPGGLAHSETVRLGLYGMMPHAEYGIRTHPAEEIYVMLAGQAFWKRGPAPYAPSGPGERSYHPSMMPHASKTGEHAFLSVYAWHGDISTDNYVYSGLPDD
jgi:hypothetical protein